MGRIEELRKQKEKPLREAKAKQSLRNLAAQRNAEERKLKAEIRALKRPGSIRAKKTAKKASISFGRSLIKGSKMALNYAGDLYEREEAAERKSRRKTVRKKRGKR